MHKLLPFLLLFSTRPAAADQCTPSRLLVLLDKSSSMTASIGGMTKWGAAQQALDRVSATYNDSIEIGLAMFPDPAECSPGHTVVTPARGSHDAIIAALGAPPPATGNWTPMAQSLDAVAQDSALADATRRRFVLLITDGWQWCYPYDSATRFTPVDAVARLHQSGITTYVVGFGGEVDPLTLGRSAVAGGTALPGCNPDQSNPAAANLCYYQAESPAALLSALMAIALQVSGEVCDGIDNNCDGRIDENGPGLCPTGQSCNAGRCVDPPNPSPAPPGPVGTPLPPPAPPAPPPSGGAMDAGGCACQTGGRGTTPPLTMLLLVGITAAVRAGRRGRTSDRCCRR